MIFHFLAWLMMNECALTNSSFSAEYSGMFTGQFLTVSCRLFGAKQGIFFRAYKMHKFPLIAIQFISGVGELSSWGGLWVSLWLPAVSCSKSNTCIQTDCNEGLNWWQTESGLSCTFISIHNVLFDAVIQFYSADELVYSTSGRCPLQSFTRMPQT